MNWKTGLVRDCGMVSSSSSILDRDVKAQRTGGYGDAESCGGAGRGHPAVISDSYFEAAPP